MAETKELSPLWYSKFQREVYANTQKIDDVLEIVKRLEIVLADKNHGWVTLERGQQGRIGIKVAVPDYPDAEVKVARCAEIAVKEFTALERDYPRQGQDTMSKTEKAAEAHYKLKNKFKNEGFREQSP